MNLWLVLRLSLLGVLSFIAFSLPFRSDAQQTTPTTCDFPLPRPSQMKGDDFEKLLYAFLEKRCYQSWVTDREIRNTGPVIAGVSFGTHNAVKIFYSPQAWDWLKTRNREGAIADGAVIVKEMFHDPAKQDAKVTGWTVMIKDSKGSFDGWYWSYHSTTYPPSSGDIDYHDSGRSEERRVGKECRSRWAPDQWKEKEEE